MKPKRHVREGIGTLYRGLVREESLDKTYEKERMRVMQILSLLPKQERDSEVEAMRPASDHLGLYARHRPKSASGEKCRPIRPNMNKKVKVRHKKCANLPSNDHCIQTSCYHRENCPPHGNFSIQKTPTQNRQANSLQRNLSSKYESVCNSKKQRSSAEFIASPKKCPLQKNKGDSWKLDGSHCKSCYQSASKWPKPERTRLNELYWELGKPKRSGRSAMDDHLSIYVRRHQVVFKDRPAKEIKDRVRHMIHYNQFKEIGEKQYWKSFQ